MADLTQILQAVERGEENSSERLLPLVYEELRRLAAIKMSHEAENQTLQPTALVHEAWLRLTTDEEMGWQNRGHFFGAAAEAMRRILIERARRKSRLKHGGGQVRIDVQELEVMKFFGGLTNQEAAESLKVTERTVERHWAYAKAWLFSAVRREL